jgi:Type ISP C-terminal specificity domain
MRRTCDDIWVIDCSPEGHQPEVNTRIFQGVQQPVCIVLASRSKATKLGIPANVHFQALPLGKREIKFEALAKLGLARGGWTDAPTEWRAPFLPASQGAWATFPKLQDFFIYNGSGVMPGRTWIIAPDKFSLRERWKYLIEAPLEKKDDLLQPHLNLGELGDRHAKKVLGDALPGFPIKKTPLSTESSDSMDAIQYAFRSFDRQWIIPDKRVINRPNPELWRLRSSEQIFLTAPSQTAPKNGPAVTFTAYIPDLDHYAGRGGRAFPLWADVSGELSNIQPILLTALSQRLGLAVTPQDFLSYVAATAANPAYTARFQKDLSTPGLRIPITSTASLFKEAVQLGQRLPESPVRRPAHRGSPPLLKASLGSEQYQAMKSFAKRYERSESGDPRVFKTAGLGVI